MVTAGMARAGDRRTGALGTGRRVRPGNFGMKRKAAIFAMALLAALAGWTQIPEAAPAHHGAQDPLAQERAKREAFAWLAGHQNLDGSWGKDGTCRPALTAVCVLGFLNDGRGPLDQEYGDDVIRAAAFLAKSPVHLAESPAGADAAVLWVLAESYDFARFPFLKEAVLSRAALLDTERPTCWHVWAWVAMVRTADPPPVSWRDLLRRYETETTSHPSPFSVAPIVLGYYRVGTDKELADALREFASTDWNQWRSAPVPLEAALSISLAVRCAGIKRYKAWSAAFWEPVLSQQAADGYWPPSTFRLSAEQASFAGAIEEDRTILATAAVLLCMPPERFIPRYIPRAPSKEHNPFDLPPEDDPAE